MKKSKVLFLLSFILVCNVAQACDCLIPDVSKLEPNAVMVFKGKVLKKSSPSPETFSYMFSPTKIYKGSDLRNIVVLTPSAGASCGVSFSVDSEYVVFAYKVGNELHSSLCNSWPNSKSFEEETLKLEKYFQEKLK